MSAFKDADVKLNEANAARFTLLDSLKREAKPRTSGDPSAEEMARLALTRDALNGVVGEIRASYDEAARASVTGMDEPQQKTAQDLMAKYTEEIEKMLREKAGARRGPSGGDGKVPVRRGGK